MNLLEHNIKNIWHFNNQEAYQCRETSSAVNNHHKRNEHTSLQPDRIFFFFFLFLQSVKEMSIHNLHDILGLEWLSEDSTFPFSFIFPLFFAMNQRQKLIIEKTEEKTYLFAVDDMGLLNDLVNNRRISICNKPKTPRPTRLPILHHHWIGYLPIFLEILCESIYTHHHHQHCNNDMGQ